jgi:hypothetical protein
MSQTMDENSAYRPIPGWRPSTPEIRNEDIPHLLTLHPAIAIHFWAIWDRVLDDSMDRNIATIARQFDGRVAFFSCNTDLPENGELLRECSILSIPALAVLSPGRPSRIIFGNREPQQLASEIESLLMPVAGMSAMNERTARRKRIALWGIVAIVLLATIAYFAAFHFGGKIQDDFAVHVPEADGTLRTLRNVRAHFYREPWSYECFSFAAWLEAKCIGRPVLVGERSPVRGNTDRNFNWYEP